MTNPTQRPSPGISDLIERAEAIGAAAEAVIACRSLHIGRTNEPHPTIVALDSAMAGMPSIISALKASSPSPGTGEAVRDKSRCQICDWPLAASRDEGCVEGDCSYRPTPGSPEYYRIEARRRALSQPLPSPDQEKTGGTGNG